MNDNNSIDEAIKEELATDAPNVDPSAPEPTAQTDVIDTHTARKPFRVNNFDPPRDKQMAVFTHAKKLSEYIFVITEKSPVKLRWSIVSRLINTSVDIVEHLYRANHEHNDARIECQKKASVALFLLDFYAETAKTKKAISFKQMTIIASQISEVKKLLNGWVRATKEAMKSSQPPQDNS